MHDGLQDVQVLIVSWSQQHRNAVLIADAVKGIARHISIVYSDPDPSLQLSTHADLIRRPDDLFFGDKFKACLDAYRSDLLLIIHADCTCGDWGALVKQCRLTMNANKRIGVWAPLINYTGFGVERTRIGDIPATSLSMVAHTDSIVFAMSQSVVHRLQAANYEQNVYGWGVGWLAVACAYANQTCAVVDRSIAVHHPRPRGYSSENAALQREAFLRQLFPEERIQHLLLQSHMRLMDVHNAARGSSR